MNKNFDPPVDMEIDEEYGPATGKEIDRRCKKCEGTGGYPYDAPCDACGASGIADV